MKRYRKKKWNRRYRKGVPKNFKHIWGYHGRWSERKVRPSLWRFKFVATKNKRARSMGNFGKGTKGAWNIKARQYITKTGLGRYQTTMVGTKRPIKFFVKRPRRN